MIIVQSLRNVVGSNFDVMHEEGAQKARGQAKKKTAPRLTTHVLSYSRDHSRSISWATVTAPLSLYRSNTPWLARNNLNAIIHATVSY